jgi:hypothetical protein
MNGLRVATLPRPARLSTRIKTFGTLARSAHAAALNDLFRSLNSPVIEDE